MKIQSLKLTNHPVFKKNSTFTFFEQTETAIPKIFFLVGDNGAGKTQILDALHYSSSVERHTVTYKAETGFKTTPYVYEQVKQYYSSIEINFKNSEVTNITSSNTKEDELIFEKSDSIDKIIPQLLIDINSHDNSEIASWVKLNPNCIPNLDQMNIKLKRFTNAFDKMYDGSKKFKKISLVDHQYVVLFEDSEGKEVKLDDLSTGEKQIIFRIGDILKNLNSLNGAIVLIDEPETSLHPKWQQKYVQFLLDIFKDKDVQIIIATHSPYILKGLKEDESVCLKVNRNQNEIAEKIGYLPNTTSKPSLNLINYYAYGVFDESLHIELFDAVMFKFNKDFGPMNHELLIRGIRDATPFNTTVRSEKYKTIGTLVTETLPICIRNKTHHPIETARSYTQQELKESIEILLNLLQ